MSPSLPPPFLWFDPQKVSRRKPETTTQESRPERKHRYKSKSKREKEKEKEKFANYSYAVLPIAMTLLRH